MHTLRRIVTLLGLLLASTVQAHPGHPAFSLEHAHGIYQVDFLLGLLLIVALGVTIAWWRAIRRGRLHAQKF